MELLDRFRLGDLDAFETLFRGHQSEVYGWTIALVRDPGIAEDLTLETFWRIYRAHARFDPARSFGAWARRIATNLAIAHLRRRGREAGLGPNVEAGASPPDPAAQREAGQAIRRAFTALPAKLRAVATLALVEEKPYAEIADALGITVEAVKSREFRAVRLLRQRLRKMGIEP